MTINGTGLAASDAAQAFLADMANRLSAAPLALDAALDRLSELPTREGWRPADAAELEAVAEVYARGVVAAGLVVDKATGREEFVTYAANGHRIGYLEQDPSLGLLLRANDALLATGVVFSVLDREGWLGEFAQGHAEVLMRLRDVARGVTQDKLNEQKGQGR